MRAHLADELIHLSPAEKRELGEALIASAGADADGQGQLTDAQRAELRARLAHRRANPGEPGEPGVTLQELKVPRQLPACASVDLDEDVLNAFAQFNGEHDVSARISRTVR